MLSQLRNFFCFLRDIIKSKALIYELAVNDFRQRYLGSYLGIIWAFAQPAITLFIFWFVFELGFRSKPAANYPFVLWLMAGMVPWFFFSESLMNAAGSIVEKRFLVSKVVFRVSLLPLIKILSGLFTHIFFIGLLLAVFWFNGYSPDKYYLQLPYYIFAAISLLIGISWLSSSLMVFMPDVSPVIALIVQFGFWMTPIVWSLDILPHKYQMFIKINPAYYIIQGYRDSFVYKNWFWQDPKLMLYFWGVTILTFVLGALVFKRLRPHFADAL